MQIGVCRDYYAYDCFVKCTDDTDVIHVLASVFGDENSM